MNERFYNTDKKIQYLEEELGYLEEGKKVTQIMTLSNVGKIESVLNKDVGDFDLRELINLFEQLDWTHVNTFRSKKSILTKYIEWYQKQDAKALPIGMLKQKDLSGTAGFNKKSFKDLNDLKKCLNYVYDNADVYDTSKYDMHKAIWYLAWYGFTHEEMALLKKDDVDSHSRVIKSSISDYRVDNIDQDIIRLLESIKDSDGYNTIAGKGIILNKTYNVSDYLIRLPILKKNEHLTYEPINHKVALSNIAREWKRLNEKLSPIEDYYGKIINYGVIFDAGVYNRLYNLEVQGIDITKNDYDIVNQTARVDSDGMKIKTSSGKEIEYNINGKNIYEKYLMWRKFHHNR